MDHEDDIERLFSWLQTPELRYREFAGARDIADRVVTPTEPRTAEHPGQAGQPQASVAGREPAAGTSGLLGGAYRESDRPGPAEAGSAQSAPAAPAQTGPQAGGRSLDTVFGRLSSTRSRLPDPRDRPRDVPGSRPDGDRSR